MTLADLPETADLAARSGGRTCPLVVANEFAGECRFSLRPLREGMAPEDITLGVYPEWLLPLIDDESAAPDADLSPADRAVPIPAS